LAILTSAAWTNFQAEVCITAVSVIFGSYFVAVVVFETLLGKIKISVIGLDWAVTRKRKEETWLGLKHQVTNLVF